MFLWRALVSGVIKTGLRRKEQGHESRTRPSFGCSIYLIGYERTLALLSPSCLPLVRPPLALLLLLSQPSCLFWHDKTTVSALLPVFCSFRSFSNRRKWRK